eukprot:5405017-Heterocapsa_arctica.AAC.1
MSGPASRTSIRTKEVEMKYYSESIIAYLRAVTEETNGYRDRGWVTIHSLLVSPMVAGDGQAKPWSTSPGNPFNGYALHRVLNWMEHNLDYPPVEVSRD